MHYLHVVCIELFQIYLIDIHVIDLKHTLIVAGIKLVSQKQTSIFLPRQVYQQERNNCGVAQLAKNKK